jgi:elongation factor Ts
MAVTAEAVKALRERTGAGMMECKKALVETNGDLEAAAEIMRKTGLAKADKKASRVAAEGVVVIERSADGRRAALVEVNSETDFVAREKDFQAFAADVAKGCPCNRGCRSRRAARGAAPNGADGRRNPTRADRPHW